MNTKNKKNFKKGIALLFAIMLSTIFLTITTGVLNISVKELNFSTSTKDTNNAFYAADSGIECALYNDKSGSTFFVDQAAEEIGATADFTCFQSSISLNGTFSEGFSFIVSGLGSNNNSCAKVSVSKITDSVDPTIIVTKIISKGYNIGDENCESSNTNRVERVLEVSY